MNVEIATTMNTEMSNAMITGTTMMMMMTTMMMKTEIEDFKLDLT